MNWLLVLGILDAALVAVVALLAILAARRSRQLARQIERFTQLELELERRVEEQVQRRVADEERRLRERIAQREAEAARRDEEISRRSAELADRRHKLEERGATLDAKAEELAERAGALDARSARLDEREARIAGAEDQIRNRLEEVAGLSAEQARERLLETVERELTGEVARHVARAEESARLTADERARELVLRAMAAVRGAVAVEGTISLVELPSDEMKGRVIGREGRNIRALEHTTGVDLLVDDTPRAILLSSWDPLRRTIAARSLQKLVEDGRIHPARIEEVVEKARAEADEEARERGEAIAFELGVTGLHERLVLLTGRLSFATDHGQSLLQRAREVALIAGELADEMRLSGDALRRAGLLHDVARADKVPLLQHPAIASADLATRFGEQPAVTHPIRLLAQPNDAPRTPEGVVLATARRIVVSRPGARNDNLQRHMDRLDEVEKLALAHEGIERAAAVRAGRELRVHVRAEATSDDQALLLARKLALEIEKAVDYPGQIRVIVIRETRAVSYAV
ncbi:MAG: Rnase Y domain-containing protein [Acidobacteria bacterium]|jgi:ribonuclease Y|nr:Rnase Y domain-containing protein [Acidobacteriota bacterium]